MKRYFCAAIFKEMTEQELQRRESLQKLRDLGIDPYPAERYDVTAHAADILANYREETLEDGTKNRLNYQEVSLAGRIMFVTTPAFPPSAP